MINYQIMTDKIISSLDNTPTLLLHACCAPCSSYVLEYLTEYFNITVYFYNPNITESEEYLKRKKELIRYIQERSFKNPVSFVDGDYEPERFFELAKGREEMPEGSFRCFDCYRLRMEVSASYADKNGFDYFCTTLSVSPHKNAQMLNMIGEELQKKYRLKYLFSDFKKRNGYKRSLELSREHGLYRQNYCGCIYSRYASENKKICNNCS